MFKQLFKKKKTSVRKDNWTLVESRDGEFPLFIRFSNYIPKNIKDYPHMISIFWSYPVEDQTGFASKEILNAHYAVEEALTPLDDKINSFYMAQITGNGRQEWIWYTNNVDNWWSKFIEALKEHPAYPLDIQVAEESTWERYYSIRGNN